MNIDADTYDRIIEDMQQRRDVAVSDLQALIDSTVPLPALAEQMIRSTIQTLNGGQ